MNKGVNEKSLPARVQKKLVWFIWGGPAEFQGAHNALFLTLDLSPRLTNPLVFLSVQCNITQEATFTELRAHTKSYFDAVE